MKFEKAFCRDINSEINPYEARELFFSEDSDYYMTPLIFQCPSENCRISLIPVAIYRSEKTKTKIHFRTKSLHTHAVFPNKCTYYYDVDQDTILDVSAKRANSKKKSFLRSEFLLIKQSTSKMNVQTAVTNEAIRSITNDKTSSKTSGIKNKKHSDVKTHYFEHIIDCYENNDIETLKNSTLSINGKKKTYYSYFKKCEFFQTRKGLYIGGQ
ncbi:hypothetical protein [Paenibacillus albus]|uniref:Uncharacterized protein n=1 Tax=Paenibacillus albus TaxID=2495582 RepID=A0A3S9A1G1_9BACL|nr:hypothetical protein [Paenibacillus albus]AZN39536.1 hypothetical protein EJC50_07570 [Paenibacillus albus]